MWLDSVYEDSEYGEFYLTSSSFVKGSSRVRQASGFVSEWHFLKHHRLRIHSTKYCHEKRRSFDKIGFSLDKTNLSSQTDKMTLKTGQELKLTVIKFKFQDQTFLV